MIKITTAPKNENKKVICYIDHRCVIPVLFIPGIMGSNLKGKCDPERSYRCPVPSKAKQKRTDKLWRGDSAVSLLKWLFRNAKDRKLLLHPESVEIDNLGDIASERKNDEETELFGDRRSRGWGEVFYMSYGKFLDRLQNALHQHKFQPLPGESEYQENTDLSKKQFSDIWLGLTDKNNAPADEKNDNRNETPEQILRNRLEYHQGTLPVSLTDEQLEILRKYKFPVHAMGYNWLDSNINSAERLKQRIESIIKYYTDKAYHCNKVILVTHSMGGLAARYYSECNKGQKDIYGIVHGVMPASGAAAAYTRIKRGTEYAGDDLIEYAVSYITAEILGKNAAEMTAVCGQAPGALELLPSDKYAGNWLKITDHRGKTINHPLSTEDPYSDIYLNKQDWWRLIDKELLNPLVKGSDENSWDEFENLINCSVKVFHEEISGKYHPNTYSFYGNYVLAKNEFITPAKCRTQQTASWHGELFRMEKNKEKHHHPLPDGRLFTHEIDKVRTVTIDPSTLTSEERKEQVIDDSYRKRHHSFTGFKYSVVAGQRFTLRDSSENGDGTVPVVSGKIPDQHVKERLAINTDHEGAYKNETAFLFTLRSIIKIAQEAENDKDR